VSNLRQGRIDQPMTPVMRGFAFEVIATTVIGLGPVDREALFQRFRTLGTGTVQPPARLARISVRSGTNSPEATAPTVGLRAAPC